MVEHDRLQQTLMHFFMILLVLCCVLPFLLMVMASFTDEQTLIRNGYSFFPEKFSLETYQYIMRSASTIFRGYFMTILVTVIGTFCNITMTVLFAYPLSRKDLPYRNVLSFILFFTMLFNGGLVPTYMMYANTFHIKNTIWALLIPNLMMNAFYVIMMRSFFTASIPDSLIEAAKLDGASEMKILTKVILPLSKPMLVTLVLMVGLTYWNDWMNGMYYVTDNNLNTIQMILNNMIQNVEFLSRSASVLGADAANIKLPTVGIRMGIAVIAVIPIMVIYPFLQKYFVKGIVVGGVKG
ncbi:MAG TPA: carbohydrate ABC transporter permease [Candidatus Blautia faecigallinarum]|uniref:Carbohydrate ABC transporter permease n=1 Tax=Candidatus Blautia faecigallinarum TaxID=2838488 RepID=A0A9D2DS70_9FIRM|nr:carbohydrate ABC transporter permease [Candidatus Blautia faecigallinarum]